ncbi:MAG: sulfotransferase [Geminicoccaceae bacterium]
MKRFLFVAGIARSGTTALTDLLNAHPGMLIGQERYFNLVSPGRIGEIGPHLFEAERYFDPVPDETHNFRWREDERHVAFLQEKVRRVEIMGDKVPNYFWHAERLFAALPRSRMLLVTRHPLRVADSWKRRKVDPEDTVWSAGVRTALAQWNAGHEEMVKLVRRYGPQMGVVVYEDLFSGAPHPFNRLLSWLDAGAITQHTLDFHARQTAGWEEREGRDLILDEEETEMVVNGAKFELRDELVALARI